MVSNRAVVKKMIDKEKYYSQKARDKMPTDDKPKEAATTPFKPNTKIATIKTCFLEDDAISLNGRQYPTEAVNTLVRSAQVRLSDSNALPITCYLSHDKADQDSTRDIVGKVTKVWKEGTKAYANIDIPDTTAGRDFATLVAGKYIRSQSLRASNAMMKIDANKAFPQVTGSSLSLEGIDCTSSPGLPQVARIEDMVTESHEPQTLSEVFNAHPTTLLLEEIPVMSTDIIQEETISPLTSGDSVGMTADDPRDDYSKRMYHMPPTAPTDTFPEAMSDLSSVHDRLAYVMGMECGPATMEAVQRFGTGVVLEREKLQEAGAKLSGSTKTHLMKAHDGVAGHLGMSCASGSDGSMQSGDEDSMSDSDKESHAVTREDVAKMLREEVQKAIEISQPSRQPATPITQKETKKPMTKEEAIRLLAESGYDVKAPKTKDELLQEQMDAKLAEQRKQMEDQQALISAQLEEMKKLLAERANPYAAHVQRKSLVEGANADTSAKRPYYRNGDYIREKLNAEGMREQLLDRSRPLPTDINPEHLLKELQLELLGMYDAVYGLEGNPKIFG